MDSTPSPRAAGVHFRILGSLRVVLDGVEVDLDSPLQRRLLAALLVDVGAVVSVNRLAAVLWGRDQPNDPTAAIHTHVSRIRSFLTRHTEEPIGEVIVTHPPGYALEVDIDRVDAGRFERLVDQARAAPNPEAVADHAAAALGLWRGPALAEFDDEWARSEAARLDELRTVARQLYADALLALGRPAEVVAALQPVVAAHPFRERPRGQLMVALDRCGRQAEALATLRDLREQLVDELGIEPSAALQELEGAILRQDEDLPWPAPTIRADNTPGAGTTGSQHDAAASLPEPLTTFVGREDDLRGVIDALAEVRIVTVTGVGGVGKSRLALRVAREVVDDHADGVRVCDFATAEDSAHATTVMATALGVVPVEPGNLRGAVVQFLRAQQLLLVLDNCEHVLAGTSDLVDRIGRACPGVQVLATSRTPLGVAGQQVWPIAPLPVDGGPDGGAVELFCDRAGRADPAFTLADGDRALVRTISRRLDGLPLALELAAARVGSMTLTELADRLDEPFTLLGDAPRVASGRHRSLQAVVDWSVDLLDDQARLLFVRLAVFADGFSLSAAEHVCSGEGLAEDRVARLLGKLVDQSLVTADRSGRTTRYRLLETLRAWASVRLDEAGAVAAWRTRHAEHFAALAGQAARGVQGADEARWVRVLDTDFANFRTAHAWACASGDLDLALALSAHLRDDAYHRLRPEVFDWVARAVELPGAPAAAAWRAALLADGIGCMQRGDLDRAHDRAGQALAGVSDPDTVLRARQLLAEVALYRGTLDVTDRRGLELVEVARTSGHELQGYYTALGHLYRGYAAVYAGRLDDAAAQVRQGRSVADATGNPTLRAGLLHLEGERLLETDPVAAAATLRESIEVAGSVANRFIDGVGRVSLASVEARHGEPEVALADFGDLLDHWRRAGDWVHMWTTLHNLVVLLERVGAREPAATLLGSIETASTRAAAFGADARRLDATTESLRGSLGDESFASAVATGRAMDDTKAVVHMRDEIRRILAD